VPQAGAREQAVVAGPAAQLPAALAVLPFVQHVASAGAVISDFGWSHGLRSIAARNGDQFMIFQITPDGQAAVSGALTDLTAAQLAAAANGNVTPLSTEHGLDGLFVRSGAQFQVFYITPDKERVIPGVMWDAAGKDLTREQVANVPGAIPTVVVGDVASAKTDAKPGASAVSALPLVQKANYGTVGSALAPHLWMLIDPQCVYSVRAYQMLHPFVEAGKVQLSVIPISVLDYEDKGQSTKSALALLSKSGDHLVSSWQAGSVNDPPIPAAAARLQANMAIAQAIGLQGTPTLIWKKPDGTEGRIDGVPTSVEALIASIGS
jgi:thiol:disulfide interchange protein DsbG